ncbi:unknown [Ruminococcus sp. CAG:382]|nr:unknown [Ruminococcus sp. CAG:382]
MRRNKLVHALAERLLHRLEVAAVNGLHYFKKNVGLNLFVDFKFLVCEAEDCFGIDSLV